MLRLDAVPPVVLLRRGLLVLAGIGIPATAFELATERHWNGLVQLIPWVALAVLAVALGLALLPSGRGTTASRVLSLLVLATSLYGVARHVLANYDAGPLDQRYAETWSRMPAVEQWWLAVTKSVGPSPTLAPGVLGQTALLLLLATFGQARAPSRSELAGSELAGSELAGSE